MKKMMNIIAAATFIMFASTVSAQHRGGHNSSNHGHGSQHIEAMHSRGGNTVRSSYRQTSYSRVNYARGGSYNRSYGRGGYGFSGRRVAVPWGAAHRYAYSRPVYFPAYHVYYDPARCGYTYWSGGHWLFSAALPAFLAGVDLAAADMAYANTLPQPYYAPAPYYSAPGVGINIHIGL